MMNFSLTTYPRYRQRNVGLDEKITDRLEASNKKQDKKTKKHKPPSKWGPTKAI